MAQPYKWLPADSERLLTVIDAPGVAGGIPCIRLKGRWLSAAGFNISGRIKVTTTLNEIRIQNIEPVQSVHFERRDPWTYKPVFRLRHRPVKQTNRKRPPASESECPPNFGAEVY